MEGRTYERTLNIKKPRFKKWKVYINEHDK